MDNTDSAQPQLSDAPVTMPYGRRTRRWSLRGMAVWVLLGLAGFFVGVLMRSVETIAETAHCNDCAEFREANSWIIAGRYVYSSEQAPASGLLNRWNKAVQEYKGACDHCWKWSRDRDETVRAAHVVVSMSGWMQSMDKGKHISDVVGPELELLLSTPLTDFSAAP